MFESISKQLKEIDNHVCCEKCGSSTDLEMFPVGSSEEPFTNKYNVKFIRCCRKCVDRIMITRGGNDGLRIYSIF